jgi:P27 family predicted phage terminase small subunit
MGRRGPPPQPTALKLAQGMRRDRVNGREPRPEPLPGPPEPPEHLDDIGREVWERIAPALQAQGVLTPWDLELFSAYCDLVSRHRQAAVLLQAGLLTRGRRDRVVTSPAWRIYRDCVGLLRVLAREFGLTPSARSGLVVGPAPPAGVSPSDARTCPIALSPAPPPREVSP